MSRKTEYLPLSSLKPDERNPKSHSLETIDASVGRFGVIDPIAIDERTGYIISGHGRAKTLQAMQKRGESPPDGVQVSEDGQWLVPVVTGWASRTDSEAAAALIALNRTTELGGWVDEALLDILDDLSDMEDGLAGVGYGEEDLESLRHRLDEIDSQEDREEDYRQSEESKSSRRSHPIDLIFSSSAATHFWSLMAYGMGWNPGVITSRVGSARLYRDRFPKGKKIMFMDNEYHGYDHAEHLAALKEFTPKYATVRDLVTREQAKGLGIKYYSLDETLEMAEEIADYCENVILIPKYDCLNKLPREIKGKRVVLGYSVQAAYGATPLPASRFKGWPVHLLGGSWKRQRSLMNVLGDDVVSLDNNQAMKIAGYGSVWLPDGSVVNVVDITGKRTANPATLALALSLSNMIDAVIEEYGDDSILQDIELPESMAEEEHRPDDLETLLDEVR